MKIKSILFNLIRCYRNVKDVFKTGTLKGQSRQSTQFGNRTLNILLLYCHIFRGKKNHSYWWTGIKDGFISQNGDFVMHWNCWKRNCLGVQCKYKPQPCNYTASSGSAGPRSPRGALLTAHAKAEAFHSFMAH